MGDNATQNWEWHNVAVGEGYQARGVVRQKTVPTIPSSSYKIVDMSAPSAVVAAVEGPARPDPLKHSHRRGGKRQREGGRDSSDDSDDAEMATRESKDNRDSKKKRTKDSKHDAKLAKKEKKEKKRKKDNKSKKTKADRKERKSKKDDNSNDDKKKKKKRSSSAPAPGTENHDEDSDDVDRSSSSSESEDDTVDRPGRDDGSYVMDPDMPRFNPIIQFLLSRLK
jgi:hypothetical protein